MRFAALTRAASLSVFVLGSSVWGQTPTASVFPPPAADPRFALAEHAIDRIVATVTARPGDAHAVNDDRISQVVETVRAIVNDTLAADARSADAMRGLCTRTLGLDQPVSATESATAGGERRAELAYACTDYLLAEIKLAKIAALDRAQNKALNRLMQSLRTRRAH